MSRHSLTAGEFGFWTNLKLAKPVESIQRHQYKAFRKISSQPNVKMISAAAARAAQRTTTSLVSRRAFHATRARLSSPYHYPEGPYTNIPFNPKTKFFFVRYWLFMATGFFAPFGIAAWQTYKPR
ncbi:cytochrome-c oxidase chain VIIc [Pyricularia oryzae 70-15]|uniref:Cytochrome c oxidase subunit 8, mitochondrial n=1 Tax=Pyricularia oryzae (strain 70-15 / ATCC MYA-4617 / FGSC 8958) TaxID=242507 RepID=G4NH57_PYRO7|nr:cytochrome-c oxidase chain VIIc [Pyricularia oryzae 70-15]EHA47567.1 cytochrome-c oxidase chain VIIc [Pyricularia oryzae 70-15]KAI7914831.1 cytochrome-c oxidase chain VIIc [Pyricularia oryzae]KAI7931926.1 cytochrome-c oxidase chain VIIc [Pyricularia oryzae]